MATAKSFWTQLETKKITNKEEIENYLTQKLGQPQNELQTNLLFELTKKINSYYQADHDQNYTTYSLFGYIQEITEQKFKEGKRKGQPYYLLKMGEPKREVIQARKEDLPDNKWQEIERLAILGKNLVFKYKKFYNNKQLLDFHKQ